MKPVSAISPKSSILLVATMVAVLGWGGLIAAGTTASKPLAAHDESRDKAADEGHREYPENRLGKETSPYLLMHAHNPVDWYPWGPEALEKAKKENKPIFLSIGYSSCYWCHVMERKVFMNEEIAAFMNAHFVNIKVDREERPDIDDIYMTSLQVYNQMIGNPGGGGWPMSMFLTPDGQPFVGATYMPPEDLPTGQLGYLTVANKVQDLWARREPDLRRSAEVISMEVRRILQDSGTSEKADPTPELVSTTLAAIRARFDPQDGGVGFNPRSPDSPKFPNHVRLSFLVTLLESRDQAAQLGLNEDDFLAAENMLRHSLDRMARGGIRDHLGGGFHRYSTDRRWHVPHFEKMLYDQAQLAEVFARAGTVLQDDLFLDVAREINGSVMTLFLQKTGGFNSALDAETNAIEGEYYVWSTDEAKRVLSEDEYDSFAEAYGLNAPNPFEHGFVLHQPERLEQLAERRNMSLSELNHSLAGSRAKLLAVRSARETPFLDDKVVTAWNGLMIRSMAITGPLLEDESVTATAEAAADFVLANLRDRSGRLLRTWRNGEAKYNAYLDDYALFIDALLTLHESTGNRKWLDAAIELTDQQIEYFYVPSRSVFAFTPSDHEELLARTSSGFDSIYPNGNSVSIRNLQRLAKIAPEGARYSVLSHEILSGFTSRIAQTPIGTTGLALAAVDWLKDPNSPDAIGSPQKSTENDDQDSPCDVSKKSQQDPITDALEGDAALIERLFANAVDLSGKETDPEDNRHSEEPLSESPGSDDSQTVFRPITPAVDARKDDAADQAADDKRPVKVNAFLLYDKLKPGSRCPVALEVTVKEGWHINANPPEPDFYVPTEFELTCKQGVKMTRVKYPEHELLEMEGSDEVVSVYGQTVIIYGLLEVPENLTDPAAVLKLKLKYQACNSRECLRPGEVVLEGKIPVAKPGEAIRHQHVEKFQPKKKAAEDDAEKPAEPAVRSGN